MLVITILICVFAPAVFAANTHQHHPHSPHPHIIFVVADDLGWNDVGWHNPDILTPNLDRYAHRGVILNQSYVQPVCTPSRTAFMTGLFPYHVGLQHRTIKPNHAAGLPTNLTLLPQLLKTAGYKTHMVGKWHLGYCKWDYTPTYRGFDTFFGYLLGSEDYYTHRRNNYFDFRFNTDVYHGGDGVYSAELLAKRAVDIIKAHDQTKPLYLYLPFQSVHGPLQVPQHFQDMYPNIKLHDRQVFSGMVSALDEAFGNVTAALEHSGIAENMMLVFTTDNGGAISKGGNNWPLRGAKATTWEGGTRGAAFVYSKNLITKTGYTNTEMIHAVDWYPTLADLAGLKPHAGIDGVSQLATLRTGAASARTDFVYNIDEITGESAIRSGPYKLIHNGATPFSANGWYRPTTDNHHVTWNQTIPEYMLFNVEYDPLEHHEIATKRPDMLRALKKKLDVWKASLVPQQDQSNHGQADPRHFGGVYTPGWC